MLDWSYGVAERFDCGFEFLNLEFIWDLEFEIWDLTNFILKKMYHIWATI
jgi:hypothetical protein